MKEDKYLSAEDIIDMIESKTIKVQDPDKSFPAAAEVLRVHDVYNIIIMIENDTNQKLIDIGFGGEKNENRRTNDSSNT